MGSPNSSNSNRLRELAERSKCEAYLIDTADQIIPAWLLGKQRVGVTAGASAPDILVRQVIAKLEELGGAAPLEMQGVEEHMIFSMPKELRS